MWECNTGEADYNQSTVLRRTTVLLCTANTTITTIPAPVDARFKSALTPTEDILVGCYLIAAEILAILLNGSVIVLSVWKRKSLKPSDSYVVWLAISDLGHPLVAYPMIIASSFRHSWLFGDMGCQWNGFTGFFFGVNSMMTLAVMSLSRLLVVTNSNFTRHHDRTIAAVLIVFSLSFALFWALCPLLGWGEYGPEPYKTSCTLVWDEPDKSFVTASFIGCLAVPAGIMCYSYMRILCLALKTRHKRLKWAPQRNDLRVWQKKEMRLLKVTLLMCCTFMLCWTPYAVVAMIKSYSYHLHLPTAVSVIPALAAKTSHVLDPLIYCGTNKNFSRYIPNIFKKPSEYEAEQTTLSIPLKNIMVKDSSDV
nr:opsin-5B [Peronia verruculata]